MSPSIRRISLSLGCLFIAASSALGIVIDWDDGAFNNNNWSAFLNWSPTALPGAGDDVRIGNLNVANGDDTIMNQDFTIGSLWVTNFASVDTDGNRLNVGDVDLGIGSELIVRNNPAGISLQTTGLSISNLATFHMDGGAANMGGSVTIDSGGEFTGHGSFNFVNGLSNPTTIFTNNGTLSTGRAAGSAANAFFTMNLTANDPEARIDLDGSSNNRPVVLAENTALNLGIRALDYRGTMTMNAGSVFDSDDILQIASGGVIHVDAGNGSAGVDATATIRGAGINALNNSQINVDSGKLILDTDFSFLNSTAAINMAATTELQIDGTVTIDGNYNTSGIAKLTVNGDLTVNDDDFDWDGSGSPSTRTTINPGATLSVNALALGDDNEFDGVLEINSGTFIPSIAGGLFNIDGHLNLDSSQGTAQVGNGSVVVLRSDGAFINGAVNVTGAGNAFLHDVMFQPQTSSDVAAGSQLRVLGLARFMGNTTHTGAGDLTLQGDVLVDGNTVVDMPNGEFRFDAVSGDKIATLDESLTVNAESFEFQRFSGAETFTMNIDNTAATLEVNLTNPNSEWTLGPEGRINIVGAGALPTSLAGSDINVQGHISVQDTTRFTARLDIESDAVVAVINSTLHLDGGSQSDPNRLMGGTILSNTNATLQALDTALYGHGIVGPDIAFIGGSDLIAEGGTLAVSDILSADVVGAMSGARLFIGPAFDTSNVGSLSLMGGEVDGGPIFNNGLTTGFGLIESMEFTNNGAVVASGGGVLTIDTTSLADLDGSGSGTLHAQSGDLVVAGTTGTFNGQMTIESGHSIEFQTPWMQGSAGQLTFNGGIAPAVLRGVAFFSGDINVNGQAIMESTAVFEPSSQLNIPNFGDALRFEGFGSGIQQGATFTGAGLIVTASPRFDMHDGANVNLGLINEGVLNMISPTAGDFSVLEFRQTSSGVLQLSLFGDSPSEYDQMFVTASAELGGELDVTVSGFTPSIGDAFQLITSTLLLGEFDSLDLPSLSNDLQWQVDYSNGVDVWLRVVNGMNSGDFNGNGDYATDDVDLLVAEIVAGTNNAMFDLTGDNLVDQDDLAAWLSEAGSVELLSGNPYLEGDANLDGTVDGLDFIDWNENKFTSVAAWSAGDFTADGSVDGLDFIAWNANKFTSADSSISSVPEPSVWVLLLAMLPCFGVRRHT